MDDSIPRNEYTINLNVVSLDGGLAHSASVAFVTESSTLDGTAVAADASAVSSGNTSQHDGTDSSATTIASDETNDDSKDDDSDSDSKSSNTAIIVGSTIGVIGIIAGVAVVVLRSRNGGANKDFGQQMWADQTNMVAQTQVPGAPQMMQQPMQQQPVQQPVQQTMQDMSQPMMQQPVQPMQPQPVQPVAQAPVPQMATAPPPPAQPTTVADYTGLPAGGQYDQSTGQTIYILPDGARWQMMGDGSFNKL